MDSFPDVDFSNTPLAEFGDLINFYAGENLIDPWDIAVLIWVESRGDPTAYNENSMATGLGQVMPKEYGPMFEDRPSIEELKDPKTNIKWACKIYAYYFHKYHSRFAACYYYSGGKYWGDLIDFEERYWNKFLEARRFLGETEFGSSAS